MFLYYEENNVPGDLTNVWAKTKSLVSTCIPVLAKMLRQSSGKLLF